MTPTACEVDVTLVKDVSWASFCFRLLRLRSHFITFPRSNQTVSSLPWSYCRKCTASVGLAVYRFMTLSSSRAEPRKRLKQPGLQRTQPSTCSVDFWNQWPTAYSNTWYHTNGPANESNSHLQIQPTNQRPRDRNHVTEITL